MPVTRTRLLLKTDASLLVPVVALNVGGVVYVATRLIGEPIDLAGLVVARLFAIPDLLS